MKADFLFPGIAIKKKGLTEYAYEFPQEAPDSQRGQRGVPADAAHGAGCVFRLQQSYLNNDSRQRDEHRGSRV